MALVRLRRNAYEGSLILAVMMAASTLPMFGIVSVVLSSFRVDIPWVHAGWGGFTVGILASAAVCVAVLLRPWPKEGCSWLRFSHVTAAALSVTAAVMVTVTWPVFQD